MTAEALHFADETFDMVLNRHSVVQVNEAVRVLKPGGYFIHQSVGHRNTANFFAAFGWSQNSFGGDGWPTVYQLAQAFPVHGCHVRAVAEYDVPYRFLDVPSFIFWCNAVPWPEPFDPERHWLAINQILAQYTTSRGIETNEHRELLIIQKQ
jgi:SAM-dependent methyltransferase